LPSDISISFYGTCIKNLRYDVKYYFVDYYRIISRKNMIFTIMALLLFLSITIFGDRSETGDYQLQGSETIGI